MPGTFFPQGVPPRDPLGEEWPTDTWRCVMKELVEVIAKSLVDHPEEVVVTQAEESNAILVELKVAPSDMGKVIGRQGRIAKAIRTVVKAASSKCDKKVVVEILQ